jgi:NitT/TauT family transport system substrate-binding protein
VITLQESLRGTFYAPFYAALSLDAFGHEGVEIRFVSSPSWTRALDGLMDGTVDVGWGGPLRVNKGYEEIHGADFKSFAEVVTRDPFFLVTREKLPAFTPLALMDQRLASVSEVPTPWLCLQHDIRLAGFDPDGIERVANRSMADNVAALRRGEVDVVQLFEPFVEELVEEGFHVWYAAADRGPCAYTAFYARQSTIVQKREELAAMVRAIYRVQKWIAAADAPAIAAAMASYFPDVPRRRLEAVCARYKAAGIWGRDPVLRRIGYDRLLAAVVSGGFVNPGTPFEQAVDNSLAEAAVAADPPAMLA